MFTSLLALFLALPSAAANYKYEKAPAQPVIPVADFSVEVMRGGLTDWFGVHKFGENSDIAASSTEDIKASGGTIIYSSQPVRVQVIAGGNAQDDPAGSGAGTITVSGLDANWDLYSENIYTSGTAAGPLSNGHFMRVFMAYVSTMGTNASYISPVANAGTISIHTSSGNPMISILAGRGQSQTTQYTTPRNYTCFLLGVSGSVGSTKAADVYLYRRPNAWDTTGALSGSKRLLWTDDSIVGRFESRFYTPVQIDPMTDIWGAATTASGASASVSMDYDLACRRNE